MSRLFSKKSMNSSQFMTGPPLLPELDTFEGMDSGPLNLIFFPILCFFACKQDSITLTPLDLQPYGLPITILAPDSSEVKARDYSIMRDITIKKGDQFFVQIFEYEADILDEAGEKHRQMDAVKEDPYFVEIIKEDDKGFIFSKQIDSTKLDYDFRYIKILGSRQLVFQAGLTETFSLEEVKRMYEAVK